jgi:hypothetical protein
VIPSLTEPQILALAPDPASAKAGQGLGGARKWVMTGRSETAIWGECRGSGKAPYRTQIDLTEPAFKCSCPSRKFPCKHGVGLFLTLAREPGSIPTVEAPAWVTEWMAARGARAAKADQKASAPEAPADPAAQAKRQAQREAKVDAGLRDFAVWLQDLVRSGLSEAAAKPYGYWDSAAARLVDAQAAGLARAVRSLAGIPATGAGWQPRMLGRLGKIQLLLEGYGRIDSLPAGTQADIRSAIGFTQSQDEVLARDGVTDRWLVAGKIVTEEDSLKAQRTWLLGLESGNVALILQFAYGAQPLDTSLVVGTAFAGKIVYFDSAVPQRALLKSRQAVDDDPGGVGTDLMAYGLIEGALDAYAAALAANPWVERFPMLLGEVTPARSGARWFLRDSDCCALPLAARFDPWPLVAVGGGRPKDVFCEYDGDTLLPLSARTGQSFEPVQGT